MTGTLQIFDLPFLMTGGGPVNRTLTPIMFLYNNFRSLDRTMGYTVAGALIMMLAITAINTIVFTLRKNVKFHDGTPLDADAVIFNYDRQSNKEFKEIYQTAKERLSKYKIEMIREFSMDAVKRVPEGSLDFVYIDANHEYPWVTEDIVHWSKRVRPGGIVAGHDYYRSILKDSKCHVLAAVNGYTYAYRINPWFILGTQARVPGQARDKSRSWMWVKQ
jgi:hypothetical protein